jgi:hypothetical protein
MRDKFLRAAKVAIFVTLVWNFGFDVFDIQGVKAQDSIDQPTAPVGVYVEESGELDFPCEQYEVVDSNVDNPVVQRGELKILNIEPAQICVMPSSLEIGWSHGSLTLEHPQAMYRSHLRVIDGNQVIGEVLIYQGIGTYRIIVPGILTYIRYRDGNPHSPQSLEYWFDTGADQGEKRYKPNYEKFNGVAWALATSYSLLAEEVSARGSNYPDAQIIIANLQGGNSEGETVSVATTCKNGLMDSAATVVQLDLSDKATVAEQAVEQIGRMMHESMHLWLATRGNSIQLEADSMFASLAGDSRPSPEESFAALQQKLAMEKMADEASSLWQTFNFPLFQHLDKALVKSYALRDVKERLDFYTRLFSFGDTTTSYIWYPSLMGVYDSLDDFQVVYGFAMSHCLPEATTNGLFNLKTPSSGTYDSIIKSQIQNCIYKDVWARVPEGDKSDLVKIASGCKEVLPSGSPVSEIDLLYKYQCIYYVPSGFQLADYYAMKARGKGHLWGLPNNQLRDFESMEAHVNTLAGVESRVPICLMGNEFSVNDGGIIPTFKFRKVEKPGTKKFVFLPLIRRR